MAEILGLGPHSGFRLAQEVRLGKPARWDAYRFRFSSSQRRPTELWLSIPKSGFARRV